MIPFRKTAGPTEPTWGIVLSHFGTVGKSETTEKAYFHCGLGDLAEIAGFGQAVSAPGHQVTAGPLYRAKPITAGAAATLTCGRGFVGESARGAKP